MKPLDSKLRRKLLKYQKEELAEAIVYQKLAKQIKSEENRKLIQSIGEVEQRHAAVWQYYTKEKVKPNRFMVWLRVATIRIFGLTFGIKQLEGREKSSAQKYKDLLGIFPEVEQIQKDEVEHEQKLISLIDEKSLCYLGSIVLGLNDALVELTGVLAGLTFGLQNSRMIAVVGIITGISAALSMAGSEYLSIKTDAGEEVKPIKAAVYTGIAYIATVVCLILPYLLCSNVYIALVITILTAIGIIALFNYYTSVAKGFSFKKRFIEMLCISLSVAFISFIVGVLVKAFFNVEV